jgi:RNA polymerase sigma factor (sigma-70 family)
LRSDAELLHAARTDAQAFRELYDRYASRIYGYHLRRSGHTDAAHDLTAETFAQAWLARRRFRDRAAGSAIPWLFGIARNVLLIVGPAPASRTERLRAARDPGAARRRARCRRTRGGVARRARGALADLPDGQRDAIGLRVGADLDYEAVAAALGTSAPSARLRVHRGLTTLRNRLGNGRETPT